jgi:hypothetical protein
VTRDGEISAPRSQCDVEVDIKRQINEQPTALVGLPLSHVSRAVDMAMFAFGRVVEHQTRRGLVHVPQYSLHIQETWRIQQVGRIVVGYGDWHYPPRGSTVGYDDFVERDASRTRQDDLRDEWLAHGDDAHTVVAATGADAGDLSISFVDGCVLETFVNQASDDEDGDIEFWRLIGPDAGDTDGRHFVVTARGITS